MNWGVVCKFGNHKSCLHLLCPTHPLSSSLFMEEPYYVFKCKQKRQHNDGLLSIYEKVHHMMDRVHQMMDGVHHMMDTFFRQICYISGF